MSKTRATIPLAFKLAAFASVLATVPVAFSGWRVFELNRAGLEASSLSVQANVAEQVDRDFAREILSLSDVLESSADVLADPERPGAQKVALLEALVTGTRALDGITIYDASGALIDRVQTKTTGQAPPAALTQPARDDASARGLALVSRDLVVVPIRARDDDARVTGFVAARAHIEQIEALMVRLADETLAEHVGAVFVLDERGDVIVSSAKDASGAQRAPQLMSKDALAKLPRDVAQSGAFDNAGKRYFGAIFRRSDRAWQVICETEQAVVFAPLYETRATVIVTLAASAIIALLIGLLWSRWITRPVRALMDFAQALSKRQFEKRANVKTSDELALLADAMNRAADDLQSSERKLVEEARVRQDLRRFLPAELVDAVAKGEHDMNLGGAARDITVLFADVVAFTPLTKERSPEEVVAILNELFTTLSEIVFRHGGIVDKFIGDSVMALFGARPGASGEHAKDALRCAEDMLTWLELANQKLEAKHGVRIQLAIGVNSGSAVVGNIGSDSRMEYTAIGDCVNLAARLEAVARPQQILCGPEVKARAPEFEFDALGKHTLSSGEEQDVFALVL